ncbi:MAG: ROK family protein [Isosphaeraceae bacterium]
MADAINYLGLEIGGTKLQIGRGDATGQLSWLERRTVDAARGAAGIRHQILEIVAGCRASGQISPGPVHWGVGFGGPVDVADGSIRKSHQIEGWSGFGLGQWLKDETGAESVIVRNDADTAALAECLAGAGRGFDPVVYVTVGSGIGGGLVINQKIYKGAGRGATEVGHLRVANPDNGGTLVELELVASGWSIQRRAGCQSVPEVLAAAKGGDARANEVLLTAAEALGTGLSHVVQLMAPRLIILGGGVNMLPDDWWGSRVRASLAEKTMGVFAGMTDVVPAALGENVVVQGGVLLAAGADG